MKAYGSLLENMRWHFIDSPHFKCTKKGVRRTQNQKARARLKKDTLNQIRETYSEEVAM